MDLYSRERIQPKVLQDFKDSVSQVKPSKEHGVLCHRRRCDAMLSSHMNQVRSPQDSKFCSLELKGHAELAALNLQMLQMS